MNIFKVILLTFFVFFIKANEIYAQSNSDCQHELILQVIDKHDNTPLVAASAFLKKKYIGAYSNEQGYIVISKACIGKDTLIVSHIGCETVTIPLQITLSSVSDTTIIHLEHHTEMLDAVVIHEHKKHLSASEISASLSESLIQKNIGNNITDMMSKLPGIEAIPIGPTNNRPSIDGLGGSRIGIVQNGTNLATQDWSDDHSIELDPFAIESIQLARNSNASLGNKAISGGSVVISTASLPQKKGITAKTISLFKSNSSSFEGGVNFKHRINSKFGYATSIYGANAADANAPNYVLSNTGNRLLSSRGKLFYDGTKLKATLGYSYYLQSSGILRAAHIGNLTDLNRALHSTIPLVIKPRTREILNPKQFVDHHWLSSKLSWESGRNILWILQANNQINTRKEFDIRRGGRSILPATHLSLETKDIKLSLDYKTSSTNTLKIGTSYQRSENRNVPGTKAKPFIPFYNQDLSSFFTSYNMLFDKWSLDAHASVYYNQFEVKTYERNDLGKNVLKVSTLNNVLGNISLGTAYFITQDQSLKANLSFAQRQPNPAELFADGLHHSQAVVEVGDINLQKESGLKLSTIYSREINKSFQIYTSAFAHLFEGYISKRQLIKPRLTIRGAFPVLAYEQTDAVILGSNIDAHWSKNHFKIDANINYLYGNHFGGEPLPDIAPLNAALRTSYTWTFTNRFKDLEVGFNTNFYSKQTRLPSTIIADAPNAYLLFGLEAAGRLVVYNKTLLASVNVQNIFNTSYRNYLNRLRYFADNQGRNITVKLEMNF